MTIGIAGALVISAGLYLVALGAAAIFRPLKTKVFLAAFASSARVHFLELTIRLAVGAALVQFAPYMKFPIAFVVFGWILIGTTIGLFAIPWRLHHKFAQWSVPLATRNMYLFGSGSLLGGLALLLGVFLGR